MSKEKVIEIARGELGYTETPVNRTKYWQDYDPAYQGQPWCVAFLWWCFAQAGERMAFFGGGRTASCSLLLRWYKEQGLTVPVEQVQPGDIVLLNFNGKGTTDHCGLVTAAGDYEGQTFVWTIEGNTSTSQKINQENGDIVAEKIRYGYQIVGVCRPQYKKEEPALADKKPDYAGHWAIASIIKAMDKGVMKGYPDGSFRPNDTPTRAELAVILDRLGLLD